MGQVVQATALFGLLAFPMRVIGFFLQELPRAVVTSERLDRVMATPAEPTPDPADRRRCPRVRSTLELSGVTFAHGDDPPVLDDVSLRLGAGEVVAAGGRHRLREDHAVRAAPAAARAPMPARCDSAVSICARPTRTRCDAAVGLVFQETFLFADTVRENVTLG